MLRRIPYLCSDRPQHYKPKKLAGYEGSGIAGIPCIHYDSKGHRCFHFKTWGGCTEITCFLLMLKITDLLGLYHRLLLENCHLTPLIIETDSWALLDMLDWPNPKYLSILSSYRELLADLSDNKLWHIYRTTNTIVNRYISKACQILSLLFRLWPYHLCISPSFYILCP